MLYVNDPFGGLRSTRIATEICALTVPRLCDGSSGAPEASRNRSMASSSAAAGTGPSTRTCARAGGDLPCVSGTSNSPLVSVSCRPDGSVTPPRPSATVACRPRTRMTMSESRIGGRPSIRFTEVRFATTSIERPSSGTGGPPSLSADIGAFVAISRRSTFPPDIFSKTQARTFGLTNCGQMRWNESPDISRAARPTTRRGSAVARSTKPDIATFTSAPAISAF